MSHETIYVSLFVQSRGALRKELTRYLRSGHTTRRPRGHSVMNGQGQLRGHAQHPRTARRSQRPGRARPLGRRPPHGQTHARHGDAGGTQDPLRHADRAPARARRRRRRRRARRQDHRAPRTAASFAHLGPRQRDGRPRPVHASTPACRSTSATRAAPGSAAATRTPTACYASTSPNAPRSRTTPRPTSTRSQPNSTAGLDKHSDGDHHHKHSTKRCDDPLNPQPSSCVVVELVARPRPSRNDPTMIDVVCVTVDCINR